MEKRAQPRGSRRSPKPAAAGASQLELGYVGVEEATEEECPRIIGLGSLPLTLGRKAAAGVSEPRPSERSIFGI